MLPINLLQLIVLILTAWFSLNTSILQCLKTVLFHGNDDVIPWRYRGTYHAYVKLDDGSQKLIHTYHDKGSFGELALLYNQPRAATIQAGGVGSLWALDRQTFRRIILKSAFKKRKMYEALIDCVPMLKTLQVHSTLSLGVKVLLQF